MISLCAPSFDISGEVASYSGVAERDSVSRRGKRVATLDGGAVLVDNGYSVADKTFKLSMPDTDGSLYTGIQRLMRYHSRAILTCDEGCFVVLLSGLAPNGQRTRVTAEVLEEI